MNKLFLFYCLSYGALLDPDSSDECNDPEISVYTVQVYLINVRYGKMVPERLEIYIAECFTYSVLKQAGCHDSRPKQSQSLQLDSTM